MLSSFLAPNREWLDEPNVWGAPGFLAIVGTADNTTVRVRSKAKVAAGAAGSGIGPLGPGGEATYTLGRGDVLELTSNVVFSADAECTFPAEGGGGCTGGRVNDLTGSTSLLCLEEYVIVWWTTKSLTGLVLDIPTWCWLRTRYKTDAGLGALCACEYDGRVGVGRDGPQFLSVPSDGYGGRASEVLRAAA